MKMSLTTCCPVTVITGTETKRNIPGSCIPRMYVRYLPTLSDFYTIGLLFLSREICGNKQMGAAVMDSYFYQRG